MKNNSAFPSIVIGYISTLTIGKHFDDITLVKSRSKSWMCSYNLYYDR